MRRSIAAAIQNALLFLGSSFVPLLSRRGELRLASFLAWFLCRPLFRFYRYAVANVELAFGDSLSAEEKSRIVRESFRNAARVLVDYFWFAHRTEKRLARHAEIGDETIRRWIEGDFPGVFVTAHFGNWELAGLVVAAHGRRLWSVFKSLGSAAVAKKMLRFRSGGNGEQRVIPREGAMRGLLRALRARDVVALLLDQHVELSDGGEYHPFFGKKAAFSGAVGVLAGRLRVPVLLAETVYDPARDVYSIRAVREFPVEQVVAMSPSGLTGEIVRGMEEMIRRTPGQWLWMYRRWKRYLPSEGGAGYPWYAKPDRKAAELA